ncbi:MAG TPA: DUF805 domain-containing protein [Xanthomonadaceae bacterium]|nr:DUF805 domain-containing protein [Xanthomonadaceae bacterium]
MKTLLFSFEGRIGRKTFWLTTLALVALMIAVQVVAIGLALVSETLGMIGMLVMLVVAIGVLWAGLAIQAKRWHDLDKSGWWILINLVPVVGGLYALVMTGFVKGSDGRNQFGDDPVPGMAAGNLRTA